MVATVYWSGVVGLALVMLFYGLNLALFVWFALVLRRRPATIRKLRWAAVLSFLISSISVAGKFIELSGSVEQEEANLGRVTVGGSIIKWAQLLQISLADIVLIWRLYALSLRKWRACAIPIALEAIALTLGFIHWVTDSVWYWPWANYPVSDTFLVQDEGYDGYLIQPVLMSLYYVFVLLVNILTTGLIARKLSSHCKEVQEAIGKGDPPTRYIKYLAVMLQESGAIFTAYMIFVLISRDYGALVLDSDGTSNVVLGITPTIVGLYPMSVILFAEYGKHITKAYSPSSTLIFPAASSSGEDMERRNENIPVALEPVRPNVSRVTTELSDKGSVVFRPPAGEATPPRFTFV